MAWVRGDDGTPDMEFLRGVQENPTGCACDEALMPEICGPRLPCKDCGWLPVGKATGAAVTVEGLLKGAGSALIAGQNGAAAVEDLHSLWRKAARLHLSFIR